MPWRLFWERVNACVCVCVCVCCREPAVRAIPSRVCRVYILCVCVSFILYALPFRPWAVCSRLVLAERSRQRFHRPMRFTARSEAEAHERNTRLSSIFPKRICKYIASYVNTTRIRLRPDKTRACSNLCLSLIAACI